MTSSTHVRIPLDVHADFEENGCDIGILTDGVVVFGTHAAVDQNLRHRVFGGGVFFLLPRFIERVNVVFRMVIADELEGIADTLDKVFLLDDGHDCVPFLMVGRVCSLFIDVVFQTTLIGVIVLSIDMRRQYDFYNPLIFIKLNNLSFHSDDDNGYCRQYLPAEIKLQLICPLKFQRVV